MRISILAAVVLLSGCASITGALRQRASVDLACSEERVSVRAIGAQGYRASGCGRGRSYTCVGRTCVGDGPVESGPALAAAMPADALRDAIVRATYDEMRACVGRDVDFSLEVEVDERGALRPIEILVRVGPHEAACISRVARESSSPAWAGAGPVTLVYDAAGPPPEPAAPVQEIAAQPGPAAAVEPATLRARVDAHRAAILACVSAPVVALTIEWSAEGALVAHLRDGAGTPAEGCVRAVLAGERIEPAPGTPGSLLHVVEGS